MHAYTNTHTHAQPHTHATHTHMHADCSWPPRGGVWERNILATYTFAPWQQFEPLSQFNALMPRCSSANKELHAHWHHPSNYVNKMFYTDTIVYRPCIFPSSSPPTSLLSPFLSNKIKKKKQQKQVTKTFLNENILWLVLYYQYIAAMKMWPGCVATINSPITHTMSTENIQKNPGLTIMWTGCYTTV